MKKTLVILSAFGLLFSSCNYSKKNEESNNMENPLLSTFNTPFEVPPFEKIKSEHYMPAFKEAMKVQNENIQAIIENSEEPTFTNTIEAIENSGELLNKISNIFFNVKSAETNEELQKITKELSPLISTHEDKIGLNPELFSRVKIVYNKKDTLGLNTEQNTLLEKTYKNFIRGGANLTDTEKIRFSEINKEISMLYIEFSENLLAEKNRFKLVIDNNEDLDGLTENTITAAAETAKEKGYEGKWVFTLHKPSLLPFLENSKKRDLRKKLYEGYIMQCNNNDSLDNKKIINQIANLRIERANILGYNSAADFILEKNMAKNAKNVYELLDKLMPATMAVAKKEVADMQAIVDKDGGNFKIQGWDYWYYSAKVKEQKYALNENDIRPYLRLENVRNGMFWLATQLYGITFTKMDSMPIYQKDVEVFEVKEENGEHIGILYMDYYPRATKRSGAWCTSYRTQRYKNNEKVTPIVSVVCNASTPMGDIPSLLSVDETKTLFHEFGHALDGLFSNKHYSSLRVPQDFVEFPSQVMENWAFTPEVLNHYAKHYKTGETIPKELINKIQNTSKFNQGFATGEYLAAAYLDMNWHTLTTKADRDVDKFEADVMKKIGLINEISPRYSSTYFQHIFSGNSYSAGYYVYIWAAVLDSDAFEAFKENGILDKKTAAAYRKNVLELGGTEDAMGLYVKFRGAEPKIEPLLKKRGLN